MYLSPNFSNMFFFSAFYILPVFIPVDFRQTGEARAQKAGPPPLPLTTHAVHFDAVSQRVSEGHACRQY